MDSTIYNTRINPCNAREEYFQVKEMIVQIKAYCEPVLIISSKLEWAHSSFRHVFVKLDQSANTRIPQWPAYHRECGIQGKIKEAICNYQAGSPLNVSPDV